MRKILFGSLLAIALIAASPGIQSSAQADIIEFGLAGNAGSGLLPGNENPPAESEGTGGVISSITFDTITKILALDVGWGTGNGFTNISGNATGMHIHGPANFNANGGVVFNLSAMGGYNNDASNGGFTGNIVVDATNEARLLNGLLYINVHTGANPGGELRGNLVQAIPEPASAGIVGLLGVAYLIRRRRS